MHLEGQKLRPVQSYPPGTWSIPFATHQDIGEGGLAGTVGAQQGMDFPGLDREVEPVENRMMIDLKGQPLNVQQGNQHSNAAIDRA